jgi:alpha-beta hydrolase superfamily lysophospholipase
MMSHAVWFRGMAYLLAQRHLHVVGADRRGSGLNRLSRGDAPSRGALLSDLRTIINAEDDGGPICVAGWCWGALPVLNLAIDGVEKLSRIALLAPALFPARDITRAAQQELIASKTQDETVPALRSPLTAEMFSKQPRVQAFIRGDDMAQWTFSRRLFRITQEMSQTARAQLAKIAVPVLLLLADDDRTVDNAQTLELLQALGPHQVVNASLPCSHGMHLELTREVTDHIAGWLTAKAEAVECRARALS